MITLVGQYIHLLPPTGLWWECIQLPGQVTSSVQGWNEQLSTHSSLPKDNVAQPFYPFSKVSFNWDLEYLGRTHINMGRTHRPHTKKPRWNSEYSNPEHATPYNQTKNGCLCWLYWLSAGQRKSNILEKDFKARLISHGRVRTGRPPLKRKRQQQQQQRE